LVFWGIISGGSRKKKKKIEFIILNKSKLITLEKFKEYYAEKEYKV